MCGFVRNGGSNFGGLGKSMDQNAISQAVREEIARRRISRQRLADEARISLSTLEKALSGIRPFTLATLVRLEEVLGLSLHSTPAAPVSQRDAAHATAPVELGAYSHQAVTWLEGRYLTLRPGFANPDAVFCYVTTIAWEDASSRLVFVESERTDAKNAQCGGVALPYLSSHIYLVTNDRGQFRTITLGRPDHGGVMHGILSTLFVGQGTALTPIACPIVLRPLAEDEVPLFGELCADAPGHAEARALLDRTTHGGFAAFRY